ncbi:MAG: DsbA family oxidoreductase [Burkholderiales bacterium]|nr:DsbA family oxidoreductase [Burkholderiales bacterium]
MLEVEIWSDVVCPWCYIGKRRFERAVAEVAGEIEVRAVYRPYQLDPTASPGKATPVIDAYAKKFGGPEQAAKIIEHVSGIAAAEGIEFRMYRALRANTVLAHRLLWVAEATGEQHALKERLLRAYFEEGLDTFAADNGITAVPTFVFAGEGEQSWMVPGAQDTDVFVRVFRKLAQTTPAAGV